MNKKLFKCIKTYASDETVHGIDFKKGKSYYAEVEDKECWRFDSAEDGSSVLVSNEELEEYFKKV